MTGPVQALAARLLASPSRSEKPRSDGVTIMLDKGLGIGAVESLASVTAAHVDFAKLAWGSALITSQLDDKINTYRKHGIEPLLGGTLFEYAYLYKRLDELEALVRASKLHIEVSDGVAEIPRADKLKWIERLSQYAEVYSEVGGKLVQGRTSWKSAVTEELTAGANKVVIEGRELGPVGQDINHALVDQLLGDFPSESLVFEALERKQQVFLIKRIGANVNLGNILPADVMTVESFRRGLKEHTLLHVWESHQTKQDA